ncbi:putative transcription factor AS2-LOB family [Medicago truncatula]|uniref:Lateral organ boundaries (LOB) domain protein n=1 Tax=Medicago truncatula TaxID=3880 RepID=G7K3J3_MEDTR|nr:LOB domain-containing protein 24 [Medicago truncatula]AET00525.1 lateral organ boundaries (LOB) domain protein [Medicago truncatula]RHN57801.1 putative transcription factor AS2-LOB family [Medicago truncatula]
MIYGRCAACKSQRRRCPSDCIFSPYFPANNPQRFASVHKIYGGGNVGKMLQQLPHYVREQAANTLYLEAQCRIQNPVYGCVGIISKLYQQIHDTEAELAKIQTQIACHKLQNQQYEAGSNFNLLPPQSSSMEQFQWPNQTPNWFN